MANPDAEAKKRAEHLALVQSLVGCAITAAEVHEGPGGWDEHDSYVVTLDDGRVVTFSGWGHDAWGADMTITKGDSA